MATINAKSMDIADVINIITEDNFKIECKQGTIKVIKKIDSKYIVPTK